MNPNVWRAIARPLAAARLRPVDNAREVLKRSWTVRLIALAGFVEVVANNWPPSIEWLPQWVPSALLVAAFCARFVAQNGLSLPADDGEG